ncbi:MAG TPA: ABC transporter ATP-binding protein [Coleofasciculaceae cyanobacterium]|jgi:lipopolysaccharide transport system ATP-binding protein
MINTTPAKVIEPSFNNDEVVLSVEGVSKKFCRDLKRSLFYGVQDIAGELTGVRQKSDRLRNKEFWALDNVSFELRKGEALGLVGKNGSGKSTLLRIIAGLIKPDRGTVKVTGRVAPLIALGAGFNPILTGRENIYANMSILGLSTKEIGERFDDVVEFAEIGEAIDSPVQTYSSGMAARLGFASAIHTEPDILLIDEVLAVGDAKFRAKCNRKLNEIRSKGSSFVLVSHNVAAILGICDRSVYLSKGKVIADGLTDSVVRKYEADLFVTGNEISYGKVNFEEKAAEESSGADIRYFCFKDRDCNIINSPEVGEYVSFCVGCQIHQNVNEIFVYFAINDLTKDNESILVISSQFDKKYIEAKPGKLEIQLQLPCCYLRPGAYEMTIYLQKQNSYAFDIVSSLRFEIKDSYNITYLNGRNLFYHPRKWNYLNTK